MHAHKLLLALTAMLLLGCVSSVAAPAFDEPRIPSEDLCRLKIGFEWEGELGWIALDVLRGRTRLLRIGVAPEVLQDVRRTVLLVRTLGNATECVLRHYLERWTRQGIRAMGL